MKSKILYITLYIASLLFVSCEDYYDPNTTFIPSLTAHYLRPSETSFSHYSSDAFDETFNVESFETSWAFTSVPGWMSIKPSCSDKSESIYLAVTKNLSADSARTAIFYLSSTESDWEYSRAMSISQPQASAVLSVDKTTLNFGGGVETQTITITSNCTWSVSNNLSWISTKCDNDKDILTVSVTPNPNASYRTGSFYIYYGSKSLTISIKQAPAKIKSSELSLKYENTASAYTVTIDSEADWYTTCSDSWINVTPPSGERGKSDVSIEVAPNTSVGERTGYVTFYTGTNSKLQIEILQRGLYIEADKELYFPALGGTLQLNVYSNTEWEITKSPNWVSLSAKNGSGNSIISVSATNNESSISRYGEIELSQPGLDLVFTVTVEQGGKYLTPSCSVLNFSDKASSSSFKIYSNATWTSSYTVDWFNATPQKGEGNCDIEVSVSENKSATERIGTIQYNYVDKSANINIHQLAKYLTIDNKVFDFSSIGGTHTIEICSNAKWTAEIEHQVSWLKLSAQSGEGDTNLTITTEDNPTVNVRSTAVIIKSDYSQDIRILVSQRPKSLTLSTQKILFFASGGRSETITVNTEGKYSITYDTGWFTVNEYGNNTFSVHAAENKNNEYREGIITISLTNLVDCSLSINLSVVQAGKGGSFILDGFKEDQDWNYANSGDLSITVSGYKSDNNWNDITGGSLVVNISGYNTDNDWNLNDYSNGRATIVNYGADKDWNNSNNSSGHISGNGYSNDDDWSDDYK